MAEIVLRPYQEKFIADIRDQFKHGFKRVVGVAPCGAGKTIMTGWMIRESLQRGFSSIFFVHRRELIEQTSDTFYQLHIPHGIICGGFKPNYNLPVQIASVQTLVNRLPFINQPSFLICDECHHILADSYKRIINAWYDSFLLGVTATPERAGGKRLGDIFSAMVFAPSVAELIKLGNLTEFKYISTNDYSEILNDVDVVNGDYDNNQLGKIMSNAKVIGDVVKSYIEHALNKSAICYCVNIEHSKKIAERFNFIGIPAAHCDGSTPKDERAQIVNDFRLGKYKILCNAELFGEGFDVPNCHAVILARPTKSLTLHIQQSMRSMRPDPNDPNKVAIILDCVGNHNEHGYPDTLHDWSLDPNKPKQEGVMPMKTCPICNTFVPISVHKCPNCGYVWELEEVEETFIGQLSVIHTSNDDKKNWRSMPTAKYAPCTIEEFLIVAQKRGYKKYWAVCQALKYVTTYEDIKHIGEIMGYKSGWAYHKFQDFLKEKSLQKSPSTVTI